MFLRPLRSSPSDAEAVRRVAAAACAPAAGPPGADPPGGDPLGPGFEARVRHLARTDPRGCWLAEADDGSPVGAVVSLRREGLWGLSVLAVLPEAQGKGLGRLLLDQAAVHGRGCLRGMAVLGPDPRAARRLHAAGFRLHPVTELRGTVDRAGLRDPGSIPVHPGGPAQLHLLDSVDRRARGGTHGPDHPELLAGCDELLVADTLAGTGYCYRTGGRVELLAATSQRLAARLLAEALARVPPGEEARVGHLTAEQDWALEVGLAAGLAPRAHGWLALRGMRPAACYAPSPAYG